MNVYPNDTLYGNSPNTGHPECICSRCHRPIPEEEMAIRVWPTVDEEVTHYEYRFCGDCFTGKIRRIPKPKNYESHFVAYQPEPILVVNIVGSNEVGTMELGNDGETYQVTEDGSDLIITLIEK